MLHPGNLLYPNCMRSMVTRIQLGTAGGPAIAIDKEIRDAKITVVELTGKKEQVPGQEQGPAEQSTISVSPDRHH
jgi:hypothetical protein